MLYILVHKTSADAYGLNFGDGYTVISEDTPLAYESILDALKERFKFGDHITVYECRPIKDAEVWQKAAEEAVMRGVDLKDATA